MLAEPIMLRCIANCLETSRYYATKGNRPLADWWSDHAEVFRVVMPPVCKLSNGRITRASTRPLIDTDQYAISGFTAEFEANHYKGQGFPP